MGLLFLGLALIPLGAYYFLDGNNITQNEDGEFQLGTAQFLFSLLGYFVSFFGVLFIISHLYGNKLNKGLETINRFFTNMME